MHLTTTERGLESVVLGVAERSVLDEAVLLELDEGAKILNVAVKVLGEVVLKLYKAVELMTGVPVLL